MKKHYGVLIDLKLEEKKKKNLCEGHNYKPDITGVTGVLTV